MTIACVRGILTLDYLISLKNTELFTMQIEMILDRDTESGKKFFDCDYNNKVMELT